MKTSSIIICLVSCIYMNMTVFNMQARAIIPFGPAIRFAAEITDPIRRMIYINANAIFKLYEDEYVIYNYKKGALSVISFQYDGNAHTLKIGDGYDRSPSRENE